MFKKIVNIKCSYCDCNKGYESFPYGTKFEGVEFKYYKCNACLTVNIHPKPSRDIVSAMYEKEAYHDIHYSDSHSIDYEKSASLIRGYLPNSSKILDYGCGGGHFLKEIKKIGLIGYGVEYNKSTANNASLYSGCKIFTVDDFNEKFCDLQFDALHLGDVLEHLIDPGYELEKLLKRLNPGGLIFIEGPLEENISPVMLAAKIVGYVKNKLKLGKSIYPPLHLSRANAESQKFLIARIVGHDEFILWDVYDTGWPYLNNKNIRHIIGKVAIICSGLKFYKYVFGNRFRAVIKIKKSAI